MVARANELTEPSQRAQYANEFCTNLSMKQRIYEWVDGKHKVLFTDVAGALSEAFQIVLGGTLALFKQA